MTFRLWCGQPILPISNSTPNALERPLAFDLDPGPPADVVTCCEVGLRLKPCLTLAIVGLFFGLIGIFVGPLLGALIGELLGGKGLLPAGRSSLGSVLGTFLGSSGIRNWSFDDRLVS
jgi:Protein of unknown function (DUF456)